MLEGARLVDRKFLFYYFARSYLYNNFGKDIQIL